MFKKKIELIKPIIYENGDPKDTGDFFGVDNRLYRSLKKLFETFYIYTTPHKELYLVGGCVRDMLLGKQPKDYDLCTNATPDELKQICNAIGLKYFDSGIKHGTLTIIDDFYHQSYEITTYRQDGKYSDHRHCDDVTFTPSLEEDLKRRDFTINSFAYNLLNNELVMLDESYLNDLKLGIIRTVGDANKRFDEDALRMLRAIRFSAQLGFNIAKEIFDAITLDCDWMLYVSRERVRDELTKILLSDNPERLDLFAITGLEKHSFDGFHRPITDMLNCDHQNPWHYTDVFHHTMDVVKALPKKFELRWAGLLHDVGKPKAKKPRPQGSEGHYVYYDHPDISSQIALEIMDILKFSNDQKDLIYKYVKYHDEELVECKKSKFKKVLQDIGKENFLDFIKLKQADSNAHKLIKDTKYAIDYIDKLKQRYLETTINDDALTVKDLDINGYDLMNEGLQGKEIGGCLNFLLELVLEEPTMNKKEILLRFVKSYKEIENQN